MVMLAVVLRAKALALQRPVIVRVVVLGLGAANHTWLAQHVPAANFLVEAATCIGSLLLRGRQVSVLGPIHSRVCRVARQARPLSWSAWARSAGRAEFHL